MILSGLCQQSNFPLELMIGIEHLLCDTRIARDRSQAKREHKVAILKEQERQIISGVYDPDLLAEVSMRLSSSAVVSAYSRAAFVFSLP